MTITTAQADKNPIPANKNASSELQDKAIADAEAKVQKHDRYVKRIQNLVIGLLIAAGVVGILIAIASLQGNWSNENLRAAEDSLTQLRVAKVKADAQKDVASARGEAKQSLDTESKRVAGEAGKKIEDARAEAGVKVEQARADAEVKIAEARRETEEVRKQNLATEARLGEEQGKRLELEKSLAPRQIPYVKSGSIENIDPLKPFAGLQVIIWFLPDAEANRAAGNIAGLVGAAGWNVVSKPRPDVNIGYFDGVVVIGYFPVGAPGSMPTAEEERAIRRSEDAADALANFLKSNGWEARRALGARGEVAPNAVKVVVGFKPSPYFRPK